MNNKERILKVAYFVLFGLVIISGGTFAYFTWQTIDEQNKLIEGVSECFDVTYTKGEDIGSNENSAVLSLGKSYEDGLSTTITIGTDSSCTINSGVATLYLNTESETSSYLINNKLLNYDVLIGGKIVSSGTIDTRESISIHRFNVSTTPTEVTVYVWLNGELATNNTIETLVASTYKGYISATVEATNELIEVTKEPGLYNAGTNEMTYSWDELLSQGIINVNDGAVSAGNVSLLNGDLVISSDGVTSIGDFAFYNCTGLTSVVISEGITSLGMEVFNSCSGIISVTIPEGITTIPAYTFFGCTNLTDVKLPVSMTSIENGAFLQCTSFTSIYYAGSETQWTLVSKNDEIVESATIHYNS